VRRARTTITRRCSRTWTQRSSHSRRSSHGEAIERAAEAGVDVFVEKPLARTTDEADELLETARKAGIAIGVDHTLRYQPDMAGVKAAYDEGSVGHVPYASITRLGDGPLGRPPVENAPPSWPLDADAVGGGSLLELGVPASTSSSGCSGISESGTPRWGRRSRSTSRTPRPSSWKRRRRGRRSRSTVAPTSGNSFRRSTPGCASRGVTGTISNQDHLPRNFYAGAAKSALSNVASRLTRDEPDVFGPTFYLQAHYDALADFCDAIREDEQPPVDGADGRRTLALAERAYELAAETDEAADEIDGLETPGGDPMSATDDATSATDDAMNGDPVRAAVVDATGRRGGWDSIIDARMAALESPVRDVLEPSLETPAAA